MGTRCRPVGSIAKSSVQQTSSPDAPVVSYCGSALVDLFFTGDWDTSEEVEAKQIKPAGMMIIDVFTKYIVIIPLDGKNTDQISLGIVEGFHKMGHKPEVMCTDDESAFSSDTIQKYLSDNRCQIEYESDKSITLKVGEYSVRIYYKDQDLKFWCTCKHASLKPELLCSHAICAIHYLTNGTTKKTQLE